MVPENNQGVNGIVLPVTPFASSVRAKGLEPIRLAAPDPKSGLATNYNTPAYKDNNTPDKCFAAFSARLIMYSAQI